MRRLIRSLFSRPDSTEARIQRIKSLRAALSTASHQELHAVCGRTQDLHETIAITAVVGGRVLGLEMFDVQLHGALALASGKVVEMRTGEGKTLAAVPAVVWYAKSGLGSHVMTVNDYLARRDAMWMQGIYEALGFSVGYIQQGMTHAERKRAYACDITYGTANEIGFDYLRDQLALYTDDQVHRPFAAAVIDEADSILIDEARIPLVIAGGETAHEQALYAADRLVRRFRRHEHFTLDEYDRNIASPTPGSTPLSRRSPVRTCSLPQTTICTPL